jgi:RNA polymerase sigma-70 factor (ECF subfamily)
MTGLSISMDLSPKTKTPTHSAEDVTLSLEQRLHLFMQEVSGRALVMMENACQGQQDVAMDLVQEAFIALHQNYANKATQEWYPLFYTILNHKLMDWRRKEARRSQRLGWLRLRHNDEDEQAFDLADPNQKEPSVQLLNQATQDEIQAAIQALPLRQQQAFMLRAWEGFDTATTAKIMHCSEGSVKTHYHRAIQSLKLTLSHLNPDD